MLSLRSLPHDVASRAEAWIETLTEAVDEAFRMSPPGRRRGSKLSTALDFTTLGRRLPRGGVDRNAKLALRAPPEPVASRAEAWIETSCLVRRRMRRMVASRAEAWIETSVVRYVVSARLVASRAEAWIETCTIIRPPTC